MINKIEDGGLNLQDLECKLKSIKINWIKKPYDKDEMTRPSCHRVPRSMDVSAHVLVIFEHFSNFFRRYFGEYLIKTYQQGVIQTTILPSLIPR
jgi:hypothetical protein